jgi:signal transduction histidine kinase
MRRRLLLVLLLFSATAVAAFALPLLSATAAERTQQFVINRTADLDRFAVLAQQTSVTGDNTALRDEVTSYTALYGEPVVVVDAQRRAVLQSGDLRADDPALAGVLDAALRNQPAAPVPTVLPWSDRQVLFARPVGTGTRVAGAVVLRASTDRAAGDVTQRWAWIVAGAVTAGVGCVLLALVVARWLLRPLAELDRGVRAVARGERRAHVTGKTGPAELRALSESFNRMSDAVTEAADQQRRLIADASHQLRNPMAALRLRIDTLAGQVSEKGRPAYRSAVAEVERLESLLDGLLALASAESIATEVAAGGRQPELADVGTLVLDRVDAWSPAAREAGVRLVVPAPDALPVLVHCPESDLAQVLDVVLDNAVKYAGQGATVSVEHHADRDAGVAEMVVRDDGPGLPDQELALATTRFWRSGTTERRGTGLGLAIADRLVTTRGGRLELRSAEPRGLAVHLELPLEPTL